MTFVLRRGTAAAAASALTLTSLALVVAASNSASAATTSTVTEYPVPTATYDIAADPNGTFWSTEPSTGKIVHTSATGAVLGEITVPGATTGITELVVTPGHVITVDGTANRIYDYTKGGTNDLGGAFVSIATSATPATTCVPTGGGGPSDLVVGRNGFVYVAFNTTGRIAQYNPANAQLSQTNCTPVKTTDDTGMTFPNDAGANAVRPFRLASVVNDTSSMDAVYLTDNSGSTVAKFDIDQTATPSLTTATYKQLYQVARNASTATATQPNPFGITYDGSRRAVWFDVTAASSQTGGNGVDQVGRIAVAADGTPTVTAPVSIRTAAATAVGIQDATVSTVDGYAYFSLNTSGKIERVGFVNGGFVTGVISSGITAAAAPRGIVTGTDSAQTIWFAEGGGARIASLNRTNVTQATVNGGDNQSAQIQTAFTAPLSVVVRDPDNNPIPNIDVLFSVPTSGPTALFTTGSATTSSFTVSTDATGTATIPTGTTLVANTITGNYLATATPQVPNAAVAQFHLANTAGAAANLVIDKGDKQSTQTATTFNPLSVRVVDAGGNTVASQPNIIFTAPSSGASLTFGSNNTVTETVPADANGIATSSTPKANGTRGTYQVEARLKLASGDKTVMFTETNSGAVASVKATGTTPESTKVSTAFTPALQVTAFDDANNPVSGVSVTFTAPAASTTTAGGSFAAGQTATVQTDTNGVATAPTFTANGVGSMNNATYTVTASAGSLTAQLPLRNYTTPATVTLNGSQTAKAGAAFTTTPVATVVDGNGTSVANATVTFTLPSTAGAPTFAGGQATATAVSGYDGTATAPVVTAGTKAGTYPLNASTGGVNATAVTYTVTAGPAATIVSSGGTPQTTSVGSAYTTNLSATVTDANNNPVSGDTVTFSVPAATTPATASGTFAGGAATVSATTNAQGVATATVLTANSVAGTFTATAKDTAIVATGSQSVSYTLTNTAGPAATITKKAGDNTSAVVATTFTPSPAVTVTDANGNPVAGVTVTFTAPTANATTPSGTFGTGSNATATASVTTDGNGVATAPTLTADTKAGTWNLTAAFTPAGGTARTVAFALTNTAAAATKVVATTGSGQHAAVTKAYATNLVATVTDQYGNPVSGVQVTFTAPATTGASASFAGPSQTFAGTSDSNGLVTATTLTADGTAGAFTVTAAATGLTSGSYTLTNDPATVGTVTVSPSGQGTTPGSMFGSPIQATVKDGASTPAPISGASVVFTITAGSSGASGTFAGGATTATVTTDAQGVATSPMITANSTTGSFTVKAMSGTVTSPDATLNILRKPVAKTAKLGATSKKKAPVAGKSGAASGARKVSRGQSAF